MEIGGVRRPRCAGSHHMRWLSRHVNWVLLSPGSMWVPSGSILAMAEGIEAAAGQGAHSWPPQGTFVTPSPRSPEVASGGHPVQRPLPWHNGGGPAEPGTSGEFPPFFCVSIGRNTIKLASHVTFEWLWLSPLHSAASKSQCLDMLIGASLSYSS